MDPSLLVNAMVAGASTIAPKIGEIVGTEVVKEMTKDAYKALKSTLTNVCGRRVERAAEQVEADPLSHSARTDLAIAIGTVPAADIEDVSARLTALLAALKDDSAAIRAAETLASIKLDIVSGGHVRLDTIKGAKSIDVKSHSAGDFDLRNVEMAGGAPTGN